MASPSSERMEAVDQLIADATQKDGTVLPDVVFPALRAAYGAGYMDSLEAGWEERALVAAGLALNPPL